MNDGFFSCRGVGGSQGGNLGPLYGDHLRVQRQLIHDRSEAEQDLRQAEVQVVGHTMWLSRLRQYGLRSGEAESTLGYHYFCTRMALQHAQGDHSGRLLAWLLRGWHLD
ncbi:hypothetical protein NDU88_001267 [Pleurodeles waltl]|uniref:Uncharacterized protein n=1 Tax=Pleurodeles waltl TaxID=8319 RepID=A0AAV7NA94_PLEWA|nr:hypothetical protein NDU88_001267 [Pleurodeles waltl]